MNKLPNYYKDFIIGYKIASLWSSNDPDQTACEFLDEKFDINDFDTDASQTIETDCVKFLQANRDDLVEYADNVSYNSEESLSPYEVAGHDFWLTRNGHGAGFWDRNGIEDNLGNRLSDASRDFGECWIYVNDDQTLSI
jgi:hypothetical protein